MRLHASLGVLVAVAACAGQTDDRSIAQVSLSVSPESVFVPLGQAQRFTATVQGVDDTSVVWSVAEGASGGRIAADGSYEAPSIPGTFHVVARAKADPARSAAATVHVSGNPIASVSIDPTAADLTPGGTLQLHAAVTGVPDKLVLWSVAEGAAGSVDQNGLYSAPQTPGLYHVVASSKFDPSKTAAAAISVSARPTITVSIDPPSAAIQPGASLRFSAAVTGTRDSAVTWSVAEGGPAGTVDTSGLYTAPAGEGIFHVVATSRADPMKSASAEVKVAKVASSPGQVAISISPQTITLKPGDKVRATATVTGSSDTRVAWRISCCGGAFTPDGLYSAGGVYTASTSDGTYQLTAQSLADPSKSVTATITVFSVSGITVQIEPASTAIYPGSGVAYKAQVTGTSDVAVAWSIEEGAAGGTIDANGNYRAPADKEGLFHIVATSHADPSKTGTAAVQVTWFNLKDHGGPVYSAARIYALWWGDPSLFAADVRSTQEALLRGLDGSAYLAVADQYMRGARTTTTFAGSLTSTATPSESGVGTAACAALTAAGITPQLNDLVVVYGSARGANGAYCGWHWSASCGGTTILTAWLPNPNATCAGHGRDVGCNGASTDANALASMTAHEVMEAITDPYGSGWIDQNNLEIGDKCVSDLRCYTLSTGKVQLQAQYSNATHHCGP
jgi:plastocyanin